MTPISKYRAPAARGRRARCSPPPRETVTIPLHAALRRSTRSSALREEYDARARGGARDAATSARSRSPTTTPTGRAGSRRSCATARRRPRSTGPVHAVRIGDGVIVTGPGETFTEYGIAVKERSPGHADALRRLHERARSATCRRPTSTSSAATRPGYGYKSVGLPSLFDPSVEEILVETGRPARRAPLPGGRAVGRRRRAGRRAGERGRGSRRRRSSTRRGGRRGGAVVSRAASA